jgi:hypothetical protein
MTPQQKRQALYRHARREYGDTLIYLSEIKEIEKLSDKEVVSVYEQLILIKIEIAKKDIETLIKCISVWENSIKVPSNL